MKKILGLVFAIMFIFTTTSFASNEYEIEEYLNFDVVENNNENEKIRINEQQEKIIDFSIQSEDLNEEDKKIKITEVKKSLDEYVKESYPDLNDIDQNQLKTDILEYIYENNMGHDPMPQYYQSVDSYMKVEQYLLKYANINIDDMKEKSMNYLASNIEDVVKKTGMGEFQVKEIIASLASNISTEDNYNDEQNLKLMKSINEKLGEFIKDDEISLTKAIEYNESKAMAYATKWDGSKRNPNYRDFSGSGGDCANFVSQCLRAGGMKFKDGKVDNTSAWYYKGYNLNQISSTWRGANMFRWHWQVRAGKITDVSASQTKSNFKKAVYDKTYQGDAISLVNSKGVAYHTIFVNKRNTSKSDFSYAAHSDSKNHNSLKGRVSGIRIYIYYL